MYLRLLDFKERNILIAEDQEEYLTLPAHRTCNDHGEIIFCWEMPFWERLKFLFSGKLWHSVLTFNNSLQPQLISTIKPEMNLEK